MKAGTIFIYLFSLHGYSLSANEKETRETKVLIRKQIMISCLLQHDYNLPWPMC